MEESLRYFGSRVDRLIRGEDLSREEANILFGQILKNEQPDLQQGAFLAAITAKGASAEEIAGIWQAIYDIDTVKVRPEVCGPLADNCGTGMDGIKTFNISTAASLVAAADGICMAKHGCRAITSMCGAADILEALGVDVECDVGSGEKKHRAGRHRHLQRHEPPGSSISSLSHLIPDQIRHSAQCGRLPGQSRPA